MPGDYATLAPVYDAGGFASRTAALTPVLMNFALQQDWMGRHVLDLGCGTGVTLRWLRQQNYTLVGVDQSPEMLAIARQQAPGVTLYQQDIRQLQLASAQDLVLAINVLNELDSLRDLEAAFRSVHGVLEARQLFVFDLHTLEGLAQGRNTERLTYDSQDSLTIFTRSSYDYERQARTDQHLIFRRAADQTWARSQAEQSLRGFPVQGVLALLQRTGFEVGAVLNSNLTPCDPARPGTERVVLVAKKA